MKSVKHFPLILFAITIVFLASCKKTDINFGSQYLDNGQTGIVKLETIQPQLSTVYVDSFVTAASGSALIGGYTDSYMGKIAASSYFEIAPPTGIKFTNPSYDSIILVVKLNKSYYGDTSAAVGLNVYQLSENIITKGQSTNFYNTTSFARQSNPLGKKSVLLWPHAIDTISIRLDDNLGRDLFAKLQSNNGNLANSTNFINYFKGLYLNADPSSKVVFGCKDSVEMRICYHEPSSDDGRRTAVFPLTNNAHQFNSITIDRTGTILGNAGFGPAKRQIASTATKNMAFTQYITGSMAKITFPDLPNLFAIPRFSRILNAQLIVRPVKGSFSGTVYDSLPGQLRLAVTDINNQLGSNLTMVINGSAITQTGSLVIDESSNNGTDYRYDVTAYLQNQLSAKSDIARNNNGLLLLPPAPKYTTTFNRLIMNDATLIQNQLQLVIYYLAIQ